MTSPQELDDLTERVINTCAKEVLETPKGRRPTALAEIRVRYYSQAIVAGKSHAEATEWVNLIQGQIIELMERLKAPD